MKALVCELCGSNAFTKEGDFFVCDYCRTKYTADQAKKMMIEGTVQVDRSNETVNLLALAKAAGDHNNWSEAYDYANRALEIDAQNADAWAIKGSAAGWTSTIKNFRVTEMLGAFRSAVDLSPVESQDAVKKKCASVMNAVGVAVQNLSLKHAEQFVQVDSTWQDYLNQCSQIVSVLQVAYEWGGDRQPLDNIIVIASNQIRGLSYTNTAGVSAIRFVVPAYEQKLRDLISEKSDEVRRRFDPAYVTPAPVRPKLNSGCFVVTATMGNELSIPVVTLRRFREDILTKTSRGHALISWYYEHGPALAAVIERSPVRRALSLVFVVVPATAIAWVVLRVHRDRASSRCEVEHSD